MNHRWRVAALVALGVVAIGCGDDDEPGSAGASGAAHEAGAPTGGTGGDSGGQPADEPGGAAPIINSSNESALVVDEDGGSLELGNVTLVVESGALSEKTTVTLKRVGTEAPGYELYSDVFELDLGGATLRLPVHVTLQHQGDAKLANAFATVPKRSGYGWLMTATEADTGAVTFELDGEARFFIANGSHFAETVVPSCTRVDVVEGYLAPTRAISLLARTTDCEGHALSDRADVDFVGLEDGEPLESGAVALLEPAPFAPFVTYLLDASLLEAEPTATAGALEGALASLPEGEHVSVTLFGNGRASTRLVGPTLDLDAVRAQLAEFGTFAEEEAENHGVFGAVEQAVLEQHASRAAFVAKNAGGALSAGFVIVVAGAESDEANTVRAHALEAIARSGDRVIAVQVGGSIELPVNDQSFPIAAVDGLERALLAASQRMAALNASTHWLSYCSTKATGVHLAGARLDSEVSELGAPATFDLSRSSPGCEPQAPLEQCGDRVCGGVGCGACDETLTECDVARGKCVSFCELENWCGGATHVNPNGYDQACDDEVTRTDCDATCVDLQSDVEHCGSCEVACPQGATCAQGVCLCSEGLTLCQGACVDLALGSKNCGECGHECGVGEGCFSGKCASTCPASLHGPALVQVPTPTGGIMCIDSTEVTVGQYAEFLAARGADTSGQLPECAWNLYFEPPEACTRYIYIQPEPERRPQECIDWCDAAAFCAWAGKRLCGGIDEARVAEADQNDASKDAWYNACSSGGVNHYPFGNTCNTSPCILSGLWSERVPAGVDCQASGLYAGVWDLIGNVAEWEDSCVPNKVGAGPGYDDCRTRGAAFGSASVSGGCKAMDDYADVQCGDVDLSTSPVRRDGAAQGIGFRCCAR